MAVKITVEQLRNGLNEVDNLNRRLMGWKDSNYTKAGGLLSYARQTRRTVGSIRMIGSDSLDKLVTGYGPDEPVEIVEA